MYNKDMKKLISLFLILLILLPQTVYANSAAPDPFAVTILVKGYEEVEEIVIKDDGGAYIGSVDSRSLESALKTRRSHERLIRSHMPAERFLLEVRLKDGTSFATELTDRIEYGEYILDAGSGTFAAGEITGKRMSAADKFIYAGVILAALIVTLFVESAVAFLMGIRPLRHVIGVNLLSNLSMNFLLLALYDFVPVNAFLMVVACEAAVVMIEYFFYRRRYPDYSKGKIVSFTALANLASYLAYWVILWLMYLNA